MVECGCCGNHLKKIGRERKNGKDCFKDWKTRKFCKKCYKKLKEEQNLILFNTFFKDEEIKKYLERFKKKYNLEKLL